MILIGVGSRARQGKDFVAKYMKEAIPEIQLFSFANELKQYCKENHEELVPQWQLAKQTKQLPIAKDDPVYGYTAILQWFGSEVMRKKSPDHWVHVIADKIEFDKPEIAIITDVRFPNEAAWVKNHDGYLIEVIRQNEDGTRYYDPNRDKNHISETALDEYVGWDFHLLCKSGHLDSLKSKALGILQIIINQQRSVYTSVPDATGDERDTTSDSEPGYSWGSA